MEIPDRETKVLTIYDYVISNFKREDTTELIKRLKGALKETENDIEED